MLVFFFLSFSPVSFIIAKEFRYGVVLEGLLFVFYLPNAVKFFIRKFGLRRYFERRRRFSELEFANFSFPRQIPLTSFSVVLAS